VEDYISMPQVWKEQYYIYRVLLDTSIHPTEDPYLAGQYFIENNIIIPYNYKFSSKHNRQLLLAGILDYLTEQADRDFNDFYARVTNVFGNDPQPAPNADTPPISAINEMAMAATSIIDTRSQTDPNYISEQDSITHSRTIKHNITNKILIDDIKFIARSLGYRCSISLAELYINYNQTDLLYKLSVDTLPIGIYNGFETDNNKRFLLSNFVVTHNSSIMKSLGLSLIMAQSGMYVPAKSFQYYPYKSLYTRITGTDNIFRGLSSFAVEMLELKAILKRANSNTLVIGDEVCRGTEHISGNSLVASTIINLANLDASFIFATHLHEIANMKRIKDLNKVKAYHISIDYDSKTDTIIYDRNLKEGSGDSIYGITFARHLIADNNFIELAIEIKNELLNSYKELVPNKTSRYNSEVYVNQCQICGKKNYTSHISPLETHHIIEQKDFAKTGSVSAKKPHLKKNSKANLLVLCTECHDKHHKGEINIDGFIMTNKGRQIKV
jgi:5-methylcytosine-specific restriction endonuclease McrA